MYLNFRVASNEWYKKYINRTIITQIYSKYIFFICVLWLKDINDSAEVFAVM